MHAAYYWRQDVCEQIGLALTENTLPTIADNLIFLEKARHQILEGMNGLTNILEQQLLKYRRLSQFNIKLPKYFADAMEYFKSEWEDRFAAGLGEWKEDHSKKILKSNIEAFKTLQTSSEIFSRKLKDMNNVFISKTRKQGINDFGLAQLIPDMENKLIEQQIQINHLQHIQNKRKVTFLKREEKM